MPSHTLQLVLILLAATVLVVVLFRSLKLPSILGYLLVGTLVGPNVTNLGADASAARHLAEFGVVFLMFSIGLEFSLPRLMRMRRLVFGLGLAQVLVSLLVAMGVAVLFGLPWYAGFALGGALAMSSTAVLSKLLTERMELEAPHGREVMGVLLFQDIAVVPLLIIVPALATTSDQLWQLLAFAAIKATVVLGVVIFFGQRLMHAWFYIVARTKLAELFVLNVLLITLGLAYITELAGLSLALGAFLAGMLISETDYRYQVEDDIKPFRDVLLGLFFVTIGTYLDPGLVLDNLLWVLAVLLAFMALKLGLTFGLSRAFGASPATALRSGLWLCAGGEFGFVLLAQISELKLLPPDVLQVVLSAVVLSLLFAPLLIQFSDRLVMRFVASEWLLRSMQLTSLAAQTMEASKHVIICGYGRTGQHIVNFLGSEDVTIVALENDPERVRTAKAAGEPVVFGDSARKETLVAAGIARADVLVITFADLHVAMRILHLAHELRPELPVVVRTAQEHDIDKLLAAGAAEVVPEALESGVMLTTHALVLLGVPMHRVVKRLRALREQHYSVFRGAFPGASDDDALPESEQQRLRPIRLPHDAYAIGHTLEEMDLWKSGVRVVSARRRGRQRLLADNEFLQEGDTISLIGDEAALVAVELLLLQGR